MLRSRNIHIKIIVTYIVFITSCMLLFTNPVMSNESIPTPVKKPKHLLIEVGKSIFLRIPEPYEFQRTNNFFVTISDNSIADYKLVPGSKVLKKNGGRPKWLYLYGKKPGVVSLTLWQGNEVSMFCELEVGFNVSAIKMKLHEILPNEDQIRVFSTNKGVVLSGTMSDAQRLNEAIEITKSFLDENTQLINIVKVSGIHQVMLEVRIAEMSRSVVERLGINFSWINSQGEFFVSKLGNIATLAGSIDTLGNPALNVSTNATAIGRFNPGSNQVTAFIDLLKSNGLIKILAKPTLISLSGQTASFLAGGEYPIPVVDDEGNIGVDFKPYGIELSFIPTVLNQNKISVKVEPVISELDYSTVTTISGAEVPGLSKRKATTTVELANGQSFAIAGLLRETSRENVSKYPLLGDIPVLGALFKSKSFQKLETELVILVTPWLVNPMNGQKQPLPIDSYKEPSDLEFYLGDVFGNSRKKRSRKSKLDGQFGYIMPD